ncbi:hypothetical protein [Burkholderia ubonensis]|uniref:hypothetical protein n=1 Tax=Burkholderia ubonensis TaxID=101571 RepID=UPI001E5B81E1|nr:hypothetical protein [Burkholderia ubonensis]
MAAGQQRQHAPMHGFVRLAAGIASIPLRDRNTLPLPLAPILVVVARRLQGNHQRHVLHGFKHDLRNVARVGRQVGSIDNARPSKTGKSSEASRAAGLNHSSDLKSLARPFAELAQVYRPRPDRSVNVRLGLGQYDRSSPMAAIDCGFNPSMQHA